MSIALAEQDLERSGITPEQAAYAGMYFADNAQEVCSDFHPLPALVIPYTDPFTKETYTIDGQPFSRVRYLETPPTRRGRKPQRYGQPKRTGSLPYFPRVEGAEWEDAIADTDTAICITEGEKKALASCLAGVPTIGLGGVFNFMRDGSLLPTLRKIEWKKRCVFITFDSDAATNPMILTAEARLADQLSRLGAEVRIVRLPSTPSGDKQGIDDLIVAEGVDSYHARLWETLRLSTLDMEVMKLNEHLSWVEQEGKALERATGLYLSREALRSGSVYSSRKVIVPNTKGAAPKQIGVADKWLSHPNASRVSATVFNPACEPGVMVEEAGRMVYNHWEGWQAEEGDVEPFIALNNHIFQHLPDDLQDFPLKLMAYKFQNPEKKIPMCLVLVGTQGSGKSMWANILREAAGRYGVEVPSEALLSDFNGWLETAIVAVMDEAKPDCVFRGGSSLKRLISEQTVLLNEKYRVARQIKQYAQFILTSNDRRVGAYETDDRRMFVVNCADAHPGGLDFYSKIGDWWRYDNGAAKVCNFLLNYDLEGWTPPPRAPLTDEKIMAREENASPVQRLAEEMAEADQNLVKMWIDNALTSARVSQMSTNPTEVSRANQVINALSQIQIRPFYTPDELAMLFPMMGVQMGKYGQAATPGEISRQLREAGIKTLRNVDNPKGFIRGGRFRRYLVIADMGGLPLEMDQNKFDYLMDNVFLKYGELSHE